MPTQLKPFAKASAAALCVLASACVWAQASNPSQWQDPNAIRMGQGLAIKSGTAQLEQALATLVPTPYEIKLDQSIPRSMIVTWSDQPDWMSALRQAVAPSGLRIVPDWANNTVSIATGNAPATNVVLTGYTPSQQMKERLAAMPAPVAAPPAPPAPPAVRFDVVPGDRTFRQAISRWAQSVEWIHLPQHWSVGYDLPITGSFSFPGDFKTAVRALLDTTQMNGNPLQPCFYGNRVIRVVPAAELCDRSNITQTGSGSAAMEPAGSVN